MNESQTFPLLGTTQQLVVADALDHLHKGTVKGKFACVCAMCADWAPFEHRGGGCGGGDGDTALT